MHSGLHLGLGLGLGMGLRAGRDGPGLLTAAWAEVDTAGTGRIEKDGACVAAAGTGITVSCLFRTPSLAANQVICNLRSGSVSANVFQFFVTTTGAISFPVYASGAILGTAIASTAGAIAINTDYHIVASFNASSGVEYVFVNGANVTSGSGASAGTVNWANGADFGIFGYSNTNTGLMPAGASLSELIVHNKFYDISDPEVLALFWSGSPLYTPIHGDDGSQQIGEQPLVYFGNGDLAATWNAGGNRGSLGTFGLETGNRIDRVFF